MTQPIDQPGSANGGTGGTGVYNLLNGSTAVTQTQKDNSTRVATTAYVDSLLQRVINVADVLFLYQNFF
jgi:hypothetical protein